MVKFTEGFIYEFVVGNQLTELEACYTGAEKDLSDIEKAVSDFKNKEYIRGIMKLKAFASELPTELATCKMSVNDLKAIEEWAKIFEEPKKLVEEITKHLILHEKKIKGDIKLLETDWSAGEYFDAGEEAADIVRIAVGPVPVPNQDRSRLGYWASFAI